MIGIELVPTADAQAEPTARACPPEPAATPRPPTADRIVKDLRSGLEVRLTETPGRATAAVLGEIDLGCAPLLEQVLRETLRTAPDGLEVDLDGVGFIDCAGLNMLLRVRAAATASGFPLTVTGMSPAVRRMFELTGTAAVFA